MAKIDVTKIEGYDKMTPEQKLAALEAFEYDDNASEVERYKNAVSKANSEAAEWKKKHNALLSEEEKKKQDDADSLSKMQKELEDLRKDKTVSEYKAKFLAQGYAETLASETAQALAEGDTAKVFANNQKFLEEYAKNLKADALKKTPKPPAGSGSGEVDYQKKINEAQQGGDLAAVAYYTRLQAQEASQATE
jgi:hypothetical protein